MKENWLDKGLRDKLGKYDSPMDMENAWDALEIKRHPKKRFSIWWMMGLFVVSGMIAFLFFGKKENTNVATLQKPITIEKNKISNFQKNEFKNLSTTKNNNIFTNYEETKNEVKNIFGKTKTKQISNPATIIEKTKTEISSDFISSKNKNEKGTTSQNSISPTLLFLEKSNSSSFLDKKENAQNSKVETNILVKKTKVPIALQLIPTLNLTSLKSNLGKENIDTIPIQLTASSSIMAIQPYNLRFNLGMSVGYGLRSKGKIQEGEEALDLISINLIYERYIGEYTYLKTGINFEQFTNKLQNNIISTFTQTVDNQIVTVNVYQNGFIEKINGSGEVEVTENTDFKIFNKYRFASIPLILGYELIPYEKGSIQLEVGISASIYGKHQGKILGNTPNNRFTELKDLDLKKAGVWSGIYGFQWNFFNDEGFGVPFFVNYQGSFHLNKIGKIQGLDFQKFRSQQILLGLKLDF